MKVNNTMQVRQQNAMLILTELEENAFSTNMEIAANYSLSVPTVSNIVNILKNNELIVASGTAVSSGGRKPTRLSLNSSYGHYVGVSIGKHTVYLTLIDFAGKILKKEFHYFTYTGTEHYWERIRELIGEFLVDSGVTEYKLGIAVPGFVDLQTGTISDTRTLDVGSIPIELLHRIFGKNIYIGDSCRVAGQAQLFGKREYPDTFFILISRRVSGILIREKKLFHLQASSFPVGTMLLDPSKKESAYGLPGSFADFCSAGSIIDRLKSEGRKEHYEDFFSGIREGDAYLASIWDEYLAHLAHALHNLYYVFGPNLTIGGEMARYIAPYRQMVLDLMLRSIPSDSPVPVLQFSNQGEYDEAFGVAIEIRNHDLMERLPSILLK